MAKIIFTDQEREIARTVLELLGAGVMLSAAFMAPGAVGVLGQAYRELQQASVRERRLTLTQMRRRKWVKVRNNKWLVLSERGRARLRKLQLEKLTIRRPRVWDGDWRIVFFDVPRKPHHLNRARDLLRGTLKRLGFVPLQKSVWAHPFPCQDEVAYAAEIYGLQPFVRIAVARSVTGEGSLRRHFDL